MSSDKHEVPFYSDGLTSAEIQELVNMIHSPGWRIYTKIKEQQKQEQVETGMIWSNLPNMRDAASGAYLAISVDLGFANQVEEVAALLRQPS